MAPSPCHHGAVVHCWVIMTLVVSCLTQAVVDGTKTMVLLNDNNKHNNKLTTTTTRGLRKKQYNFDDNMEQLQIKWGTPTSGGGGYSKGGGTQKNAKGSNGSNGGGKGGSSSKNGKGSNTSGSYSSTTSSSGGGSSGGGGGSGKTGIKNSEKAKKSSGSSSADGGRYSPATNSGSMSEVTLCYSDQAVGLTVTGSDNEVSGGVVSTLNVVNIEHDGQNLYAKLVASTYTLLEQQIMDEECYYGYLRSLGESFLDVAVTLKPLFASGSTSPILPYPASRISLRNDVMTGLGFYYLPNTSNQNTLEDVDQTVGEFYFANIPKGEYVLQYEFQLAAFALNICTQPNATVPTFNSGPATSTIVLGPHVLSYQKVNLMGAGPSSNRTSSSSTMMMMKGNEQPPVVTGENFVCLMDNTTNTTSTVPTTRERQLLRSSFSTMNNKPLGRSPSKGSSSMISSKGYQTNGFPQKGSKGSSGKGGGGGGESTSGKGSKGGKGGGKKDDKRLPMIQNDQIAMCYQQNETLSNTAFVVTYNQETNNAIEATIQFGTIEANEGDDFYAHVLGSTFSLLQQFIYDVCDTQGQINKADAFVSIKVQMEQLSTGFFVEASPSTEAVLRFDMIEEQLKGNSTFTYNSTGQIFFTSSPRSGDYYFHNLPQGTYRLSFLVTLETSTFNICPDLNIANATYYPPYYSSSSISELGDRIFTLERIHINHQKECQTTIGRLRDRTRRVLEKKNDMNGSNNDRNVVHLCYQDEFNFDIESTIADISDRQSQNDGALLIDFGTVELSGEEDLHAKISLSTFTMFINSIDEYDDLPIGCNVLQESESSVKVVVEVTLKAIDYNAFVMPQPSQSIVLDYLGWEQDVSDKLNNPRNTQLAPFEYALEFGLGRSGRSTGEFYFINAPAGLYDLQFQIHLLTETSASCLRRERRNLQNDDIPFGKAQAILGEHVISLEKINVLQSGQCQPITTGNVGPLPFLS